MNIPRTLIQSLALLIFMLGLSSLAHAQATRTWVSGVGDDVNPCSRTAPCKTYAGAISKTAAGGEISTLDPGGFGAVTITKSMTITGDGAYGSILSPGVNGIIVSNSIPSTGKVILRNLAINGAGAGLDGIRVLGGAQIVIEKCTIHGVTGSAINIAPNIAGLNTEVYILDTTMADGGNGVAMFTGGTSLLVTMKNVSVSNMIGAGVLANGGAVR